MASRDPIRNEPTRPDGAGGPERPERPERPAPEREPLRVEYRPPPGTVKQGGGRVVWAVIAFFIVLIVIGLLFWSGVIKA